jgi:hypothetical protein
VGPDDLAEAVAVLRELSWSARRDGRGPASMAPPPRWSPGVAHALATTLQVARASGRKLADQREVLSTLVRSGGPARDLIASVGADVDELAAAIDRLPGPARATAWAPALDHLEMLGVARTPALIRWLTAPLRAMAKGGAGAHYRHLTTLEEEATRQAVRAGGDEVTLRHVVLAMLSVGHQIAVTGAGDLARMWAPALLLAAGGLTYAPVRHTGFVATPPGLTRDGLSADVPEPRPSVDVSTYLTAVRSEASPPTGDGALLVGVLLDQVPGGTEAVEGLGGDVEAIRLRLSTRVDRP